jgi:hypothetical protein
MRPSLTICRRLRIRHVVCFWTWAWLALAATPPACGVITLDADFDHGSLNMAGSSVAGEIVTLAGRDNFNPGLWKWLYFAASGVAGQQVTFRIDDDFATGGGDLVGHKMVYSYDGQAWAFFDNNVRTASQDRFTFWNNEAFAHDNVYVSYGLPYPLGRLGSLIAAAADSPWASRTTSANPQFVVGQSPGGIDDLGRTISPQELFGFRISDPAATASKTKVVLVGGVHANETLASYTLEGLTAFLLGDSLEAAVLRKRAEFYVYPMVNPDGRLAGYNRSTVARESLDPNRFWNSPSYGGVGELSVVGDAMLADLAGHADILIDFHSDVAGKTGHYGNVLPEWQSHPLWMNLLTLEPSIDTNNALLEDFTTAKFGRDELGASFSITFETQFLPDENINRFLALGRNWGQALYRTLTVRGDLDVDGDLDGQDWLRFASLAETDLSGLSPGEAYLMGDLDGDGVNGPLDFGLFKQAYEDVHGGGSFAAMLAQVPEPTNAVAALSAALLMMAANRRGNRATIAAWRGGFATRWRRVICFWE